MAVALYLVVAHDRGSEGQVRPADPAPAPANAQTAGAPPAAASPRPAADTPVSSQQALINQYCLTCHSDRVKAGGLALSELNLNAVGQHAEIAEKVIRKLRGGLMPPAGAKRPDNQSAAAFVSWLEKEIDAGNAKPAAGRVPLRRLNRREYQYAVRDLLGLNIDATAWLPDDNIKGNFDNNAAALQVSPNFVDQYIYAARAVALEAVGNPKAPPVLTTYGDPANMVISLPPSGAPGTGRQQHRLDGMPFGTRGGFIVEHNFPADGDYELTIGDMALAREVPRMEFENTVLVLLDGQEFYRTTIGGEADHKAIDQRLDPAVEEINGRLRKIRFKATAGQHKLAVTFVHRSFAESDERTRTVALEGGQERIQAAHALEIRGPLAVTGMSQSASRAKIFICQPVEASRRGALRAEDRREPRAARLPASRDRRGRHSRDGVLQVGIRHGRLRRRRARCAQRHPGQSAFPLPGGIRRRGRRRSHAERSRAGVPPVVLPVEQSAGRRAAEARHRIASRQARRAGGAGEPDAGRPAGQGVERRLRVPVAAPLQAGRDHARPGAVPARERPAGSARAVQGGVAALHRQRVAQRSQRVRAADGRLHLPERAAGDALRHRDGEGQPLPPGDAREHRRAMACWARARS